MAAPTAAAADPAPAPPAAIGLLLATSLAIMDEGAGVAWRLPQGAGGLRGSGGGGGRGCEAGGLGGVRLSASRAWLGTVASTASPGWGAGALRGGRLWRARLPVDARNDIKIKTNAVHEKYNHVPSEARRGMLQVYGASPKNDRIRASSTASCSML